jgi:hypothetical protein
MAEGWSLEIGTAFRGAVVRQERIDQPIAWLASVNAAYLGEYFDRESAMARLESVIEHAVGMVLHEWGLYQEAKDKAVGRKGLSASAAPRGDA